LYCWWHVQHIPHQMYHCKSTKQINKWIIQLYIKFSYMFRYSPLPHQMHHCNLQNKFIIVNKSTLLYIIILFDDMFSTGTALILIRCITAIITIHKMIVNLTNSLQKCSVQPSSSSDASLQITAI
jgi:hypothetical protein